MRIVDNFGLLWRYKRFDFWWNSTMLTWSLAWGTYALLTQPDWWGAQAAAHALLVWMWLWFTAIKARQIRRDLELSIKVKALAKIIINGGEDPRKSLPEYLVKYLDM